LAIRETYLVIGLPPRGAAGAADEVDEVSPADL